MSDSYNWKDIRVISFNMHKGMSWLTRKSTLDAIRKEIREINPDIILLQEIRGSQFEYLAEEVWPHFRYGKNVVYTKGHHGNAILSKFPIHFSENINISIRWFEKRGMLHCVVHLNKTHPLHLICVHLGLFKRDRHKQLEQIVQHIRTKVPANESLILGGDFNDWGSHATEHLIENLGLQEAFMHSHGCYARTFPSWAPFLRLDRIYSRGLQTNKAECLTHKNWRVLSDHVAIAVYFSLVD